MNILSFLQVMIGVLITGLVVWSFIFGIAALDDSSEARSRARLERSYQDCMSKINDNHTCYHDVYTRP